MTEIYINNFEEFIDPGLIKNDVFHVVSLMKYISEKGWECLICRARLNWFVEEDEIFCTWVYTAEELNKNLVQFYQTYYKKKK